MSDIDIVAIQQQAEDIARAEYQDAYNKLESRAAELRVRDEKWRAILTRLDAVPVIAGNLTLEEVGLDDVLDRLVYQVEEYAKLSKMFDLINANELLTAQWKKLVMSIRMVGGDSNEQ